MSPSVNNVDAITMFIDDVARSKEFYTRVFEVEPIYEDDNAVAFRLDNVVINLLVRSAAHELIEPAAVGASSDGARFQLTVSVENVDTTCQELAGRGVTLLNGPMDRPWGIRTAAFADPDGHVWEIAHNLSGAGSG